MTVFDVSEDVAACSIQCDIIDVTARKIIAICGMTVEGWKVY